MKIADPAGGVSPAMRFKSTPPPAALDAPQARQPAPSREAVKAAVGKINESIQPLVSQLAFSVDEDSKQNVVKVVDMRTKEVLRQFPSEQVVLIAKALDNCKSFLLNASP